jgi:NADH:ubiquinone reductase (H+-translocating)
MRVAKAHRVLVVGGGYVGLFAARAILKAAQRGEVEVTVVDPRSYMTYQPFLPEAAAGSLSPRHVVVPLRSVLRDANVLTGVIESADPRARVARFQPALGDAYDIEYDQLIIAVGSQARTLPIPGLAEVGIGFKQVEEAISLRNHVITQLDIASSTTDPVERERVLTFCFVGGGFAGVEAIAELQDMAKSALKYYKNVDPSEMRWVLVEAANRILPEVGPEMGAYTVKQLEQAGITVKLDTRLESCVDGHAKLSDGTEFRTATLVWTAGVKPNPVVQQLGVPLDERGRVKGAADLRVEGFDFVWVSGDCGAVPDITGAPGATCSPSAQHAVRQAKQLGKNVVAVIRGKQPVQYRHKHVGSVASLGLHKGAAQVYGIKVKGILAWFMHRTYHLKCIPTFNRKMRVVADWTLALFFHREIVSLGSLEEPRAAFEAAASGRPH